MGDLDDRRSFGVVDAPLYPAHLDRMDVRAFSKSLLAQPLPLAESANVAAKCFLNVHARMLAGRTRRFQSARVLNAYVVLASSALQLTQGG